MLIGEIAKDTTLIIYYDTPEGSYEYTTVVIGQGDNHFELIVKTIMTEDNKFMKFPTGEGYKLRIELVGASSLGLKVDSIDFCYANGKTCHVIRSRGRISVVNKRETFRMPFRIACEIDLVNKKKIPGKINDISFEGISVLIGKEDSIKITQGSVMDVRFNWGIPSTSFDLRCKVMRVQEKDLDINIIGCTVERGTNSIRTLIMHLQMEEARKRRGTYTLRK